MKKIISVVGARPNFMKVAPIHRAFREYEKDICHLICHTGQHYDEKMSKIFFDSLEQAAFISVSRSSDGRCSNDIKSTAK